MEKSVYIIKPEGLAYRESIRQMLQTAGLTIEDSFTTTIPQWVIAELYPNLFRKQGELWEITLKYLLGEPCEVGIVCGVQAIARLFEACGTETNPMRCAPDTIRRTFGKATDESVRGMAFWLNVIHRPMDRQEARRDLRTVHMLRTSRPR